MSDRNAVRAAISNAYYEARNAGRTMEQAADEATEAVLAITEARIEQVLSTYSRWLFDKQGVHDADGRFTDLAPRFLAERATLRAQVRGTNA